MSDLVGGDEPPHDIVAEPPQPLAVHRWAGQALPSGGTSPPGRRASRAGRRASERPAGPAPGVEAAHPRAAPDRGRGRLRPWRPRRTAPAASGCGPARPAGAAGYPRADGCSPMAPRHVRPARGARRAARPPARWCPADGWWTTAPRPWPPAPARPPPVCAGWGPPPRARCSSAPARPAGPRARPWPQSAGPEAAAGAGRAGAGGAGARALWRAPRPAGVRHRGCSPPRRKRPAGRRGPAGRWGWRQSRRQGPPGRRGRPTPALALPGRGHGAPSRWPRPPAARAAR